MEPDRSPSLAERLLPETLVRDALCANLKEFLRAHGDTSLLLIPLAGAGRDCLSSLNALAFGEDAKRLSPSAEAMNITQVLTGNRELKELDRPGSIPPSPRLDAQALEARLRLTSHFTCPLRKRPGASIAPDYRISVGRSVGNDIVLHHASVSKVHAWLEVDDYGGFFVCDAGSKNGTKVNRELRRAHELTALVEGDAIQFGSVETLLCKPEVFWEVLHG